MARTQKPKATTEDPKQATNAATNVQAVAGESSEEEDTESDSDDEDEEVLTPLPVKAPEVKKPKARRNLGGSYVTKNQVSHGGSMHKPGVTLELTDEEARHYLKHNAVEAVDD